MNKLIVYALILGGAGFIYSNYKPQIHAKLGLDSPNNLSSKTQNSSTIKYKKLNNFNELNTGVNILTAPWCGYCTKLRTTLDANGVAYNEYNADGEDPVVDEFYKVNNLGSGVPVTVVGGDVVYGYDVERLEKTFKRNGLNVQGI